VNEVAEIMGADRVIFGSDWPHIEGMPEPLDYVDELSKFNDEDKRKILHDNSAALNQRRPV
jgi:predicted TIM-barrel fold metal-dependent hydrolase